MREQQSSKLDAEVADDSLLGISQNSNTHFKIFVYCRTNISIIEVLIFSSSLCYNFYNKDRRVQQITSFIEIIRIPHYNSALRSPAQETGERNLNKNQLLENFCYLMICLILF